MAQPLLDESSVKFLLVSTVPDWEWLLKEIESERGWFRFPPFLAAAITNLKIESYPLLYENEAAIGVIFLRGFLTTDEIKDLNAEVEAASAEERGTLISEFSEGFEAGLNKIKIPKTQAEQEAARKQFESLPKSERDTAIRMGAHFFAAFFPSFFQSLSMMVHGEKLTSLVAQAKAGDDEAFVKAVQIDRRILTVIPHFRDRYVRAQGEANEAFYERLAYRLASPPYRGKIRHKSLWLALSVLEQTGLLNTMSHVAMLRLFDEAGVGGYKNRIQDVKYLSKRISEYRDFQRRGICVVP